MASLIAMDVIAHPAGARPCGDGRHPHLRGHFTAEACPKRRIDPWVAVALDSGRALSAGASQLGDSIHLSPKGSGRFAQQIG
jgi:hypothetical protein